MYPPPATRNKESTLTVVRCAPDEVEKTVREAHESINGLPIGVSRYPSGVETLTQAVQGSAMSLPAWCRNLLASQRSELQVLGQEEANALRCKLIESHAQDSWHSGVLANAYRKDPNGVIKEVNKVLQQALWRDLDLIAKPSPLNQIGRVAQDYIQRCQTHGYMPPDRVIPWTIDLLRDAESLALRPLVMTQGEEFVPMDERLVRALAEHTSVTVILTSNVAIRRPYTEPGGASAIAASLTECGVK